MKPPGIGRGAFALSPSTSAVSGYTSENGGQSGRMLKLTMDAACVSKRFINSSITLKV